MERFILAIEDLGPLYLNPIFKALWDGIVASQALAGAIPLAIGALLAISYFHIKDYEYIQKRYVAPIEKLIDYFHKIRTTLEENHTYTLQTLQFFRDFDMPSFKRWYENKPFKFEKISTKMPQEFLTTLNLLGSEKVGKLCIQNFAVSSSLNEVYISQIPIRIQEVLDSNDAQFNNPLTRKNRSDLIVEDLANRRKELGKIGLYSIPEQFEEILIAAKKMKLDKYKNLPKLKKDPQVIKAMKTMEQWLDDLNV